MSKGPGRIERAIEAVLDAAPDNAFSVADLCREVYGVRHIEKKHRVAVKRAAKLIAARRKLAHLSSALPGAELIFYQPDRVLSYVMANVKASGDEQARHDALQLWYALRSGDAVGPVRELRARYRSVHPKTVNNLYAASNRLSARR